MLGLRYKRQGKPADRSKNKREARSLLVYLSAKIALSFAKETVLSSAKVFMYVKLLDWDSSPRSLLQMLIGAKSGPKHQQIHNL